MKKKKAIDPELKQILTELEDVILRLGFKVRYEKGDFEGGYCMLLESKLIVVNSRNEIEKRISIVCRCLKEVGVDDIFVKPNIREIIKSESARAPKGETALPDESIDENAGTEEEKSQSKVNEETGS